MSRSLRRGALAALVLAAIVPLSACAAGNHADTLQVKPDNASTSIGTDLKLNDIVVVTRAGTSNTQSGPANVTVNISNSGMSPQSLKSITVGDGATATFQDPTGGNVSEIVIPAGGSVLLGGQGQPIAHLNSVSVNVGGYAKTTFTFAQAGSVTAGAQVIPAVGEYAAYGPATTASGSASPTPGTSPSGTATPSGSASPSATATTTPTAPVSNQPSNTASSTASSTASPSATH